MDKQVVMDALREAAGGAVQVIDSWPSRDRLQELALLEDNLWPERVRGNNRLEGPIRIVADAARILGGADRAAMVPLVLEILFGIAPPTPSSSSSPGEAEAPPAAKPKKPRKPSKAKSVS